VSRSVAGIVRGRLGIPDSQLALIPNGTDASRFQNVHAADLSPFGVASGRHVIVTVGRLERQKGIDRLLRAMPDTFAKLPDHDLLIVGDGPNRKMLTRLATALGIAERVHFAGWRDDLPAILRACDLFVLPSRWEGMPNALLEAMASGLPVVAADVEGVAEVLGDGADQQVVPASDCRTFVTQIVRWGRDPLSAKATGEQNRRIVSEHFSLDQMVRKYVDLYRTLVDP
jgi:glycosyltransferase involved in cell wall biosynthesis